MFLLTHFIILTLPLFYYSITEATHKIKMVIDTDGVADDVRALTMALQHPRVSLMAVTTVSGSTTAQQAVANVARTFRANRVKKDIPVCKGAEESLIGNINTTADVVTFFGQDGISDQPTVSPKVNEADKEVFVKGLHAAEALVSMFKEHQGEIVLVAIGPLTNLALALELNPEFARWPKRLVITGGNIYGMGNIRTASTAEYNFNSDPEAASIVLQKMKCPITIVAWETTFFFQDLFDVKFDFDQHLNLNYPLARFLKAATAQPRRVMSEFGQSYRFCDEIAIAAAIEPQTVTRSKNISVAVELHGSMTRGQLVIGWLEEWIGKSETTPMTNVQLVLDYDVQRVDQMLVEAIKNVPSTRRRDSTLTQMDVDESTSTNTHTSESTVQSDNDNSTNK